MIWLKVGIKWLEGKVFLHPGIDVLLVVNCIKWDYFNILSRVPVSVLK